MTDIVVSDQKTIARPIDIVRAQFVDMHRHSSTRVHADLEVSNVRPQANGYLVTGRRRVFGVLQEDEIEVTRQADGNSTLHSLSGTNAGLLITQTFEAIDDKSTRVTSTVQMPVRGMMKLLSPLVRMALKRDLATALEEDRVDLEERGYAPA